ncbi:MAG: hypothetical protein M1840_001254 [Geoglossum simile]|nr:MAG: hypothetical protein M1840_001254 [Geoglossum simile]
MNLSYDFHSNKRSSELYSAIRRSRGMPTLFDTWLLAVPMAIDLVVAVCYLSYHFGVYMVLVLIMVGVVYCIASAKFNATQSLLQRDLLDASDKEDRVLEESVGGWYTIFDGVPDEIDHYVLATKNDSHRKCKRKLAEIRESSERGFILRAGFALTAILVMRQTMHGGTAVESFGLLLAFWAVIVTENLYKLLQLKPTVKNHENAKELILQRGEIRFEDVSFSYDHTRTVLRKISFVTAPCKTTALVGESGSGKSTLLGLVFRFFNVQSGSLKIDGQDVRDVTLGSLQKHIAVVPQVIPHFFS